MINFGQKGFKNFILFDEGEILDNVNVWGGRKTLVGISIPNEISLLLDIRGRRFLNAKYSYNDPIIAPIKKGEIIGKISILNDNNIIIESNLIANEDINKANIFRKVIEVSKYLLN